MTQVITIDRGLEACFRVRDETDTVVLKFSTGKDAIASWLYLRDIFPQIIPIYHYSVPNLQFVERALRMYEKWFGQSIIRMPHPNLMNILGAGEMQPPHRWGVVEAWDLPVYHYDECTSYVCEDLGIDPDTWKAVGIKASDSPIRRHNIAQNGAWTPPNRTFFPVADLTKDGLIELFDKYNVPLSEDYLVFGRSFETFEYRFLAKIKQHYPEDYQTILQWFPLVESQFMRAKAYESQKKV